MIYGETLNFGLEKQIERLIEVTALAALFRATDIPHFKDKYGRKLLAHAFPEEIELQNDVSYVFDEELWFVNIANLNGKDLTMKGDLR